MGQDGSQVPGQRRPVNAMPRALRHLGLTLGSWIGCRILVVMLLGTAPQLISGEWRDRARHPVDPPEFSVTVKASPRTRISMTSAAAKVTSGEAVTSDPEEAIPGINRNAQQHIESKTLIPSVEPLAPHAVAPSRIARSDHFDKWSLSAWGIYRPDSGSPGIAPNSQLGGSQIGLRVQRRLFEPTRRMAVSLNLRASTPLKVSQGKEAALGVSVRHEGRIPVELIVERRIGFDTSGRDAFAGLIAGGISDLPVAASFKLSGYAQAGLVGLRSRDGFVDGSMRLERDVVSRRKVLIQLGGGMWAAAQPGAARVDIGPSAAIRFRIGSAGVRLGGEWRHRVAGDARPGSGPVIAFGLDY